MEILIADDDPMSQTLLAGLARKLGHSVVLVENGEEAVYAFETHVPDLVLMDGQMPVLGGIDATRRIRELCGQRWTPILFVAAENNHETIVRALEAGADDYLIKPVHPAMLRAKLVAVDRVRRLYVEGETQKERLQALHDTAMEEGRVARHVMQKLVNAKALDDPMLKCQVVPHALNFSGDLVAAVRTPQGALHVMLADAVGHGLAASLNVLPIVPCFYAMTAKGFDLDMVAIELNRTLRQYLPIDRFVAATLISIDSHVRRVKVWNGGNPQVLALDASGGVIARFESKNMALGILPDDAFEPIVESLDYAAACQLFACSDGVVEDYGSAEGADRQSRVEAMLAETGPELRFKRLRSALAARVADGTAGDDMTIVLIDTGVVVDKLPAPPRLPAQMHFEATFDAEDLREIDVVALLLDVISSVPGAHYHCHPLGVIVSELFSNALDHGVLGLASGIKDGESGFERYCEARAAALARLEQGSIVVRIESRCSKGLRTLELQFRDSGSGFKAPPGSAATGLQRHGRGIDVVRALCSNVEYHGPGNDVRVTYALNDVPDELLRAVA